MIQSNFCQDGIDSKKVKNEAIGGIISIFEIRHEWGFSQWHNVNAIKFSLILVTTNFIYHALPESNPAVYWIHIFVYFSKPDTVRMVRPRRIWTYWSKYVGVCFGSVRYRW